MNQNHAHCLLISLQRKCIMTEKHFQSVQILVTKTFMFCDGKSTNRQDFIFSRDFIFLPSFWGSPSQKDPLKTYPSQSTLTPSKHHSPYLTRVHVTPTCIKNWCKPPCQPEKASVVAGVMVRPHGDNLETRPFDWRKEILLEHSAQKNMVCTK